MTPNEANRNADYSALLDEVAGPDAADVRCDDCRQEYAAPPYYTFPVEACQMTSYDLGGVIKDVVHDCTGNLCPDCADHLEPDDENDPRRR